MKRRRGEGDLNTAPPMFLQYEDVLPRNDDAKFRVGQLLIRGHNVT